MSYPVNEPGARPNASIGTPGTATFAILDNDPGGVVQCSAAISEIAESGTAIITMTRQSGAASGVLVDFATTDGASLASGTYIRHRRGHRRGHGDDAHVEAVPDDRGRGAGDGRR